jgi:hypothetical protein
MLVAWTSVGLAAAIMLWVVMRGNDASTSTTQSESPAPAEDGGRPAQSLPPESTGNAAPSEITDADAERPILPSLAGDPPPAKGAIAAEPPVPQEDQRPIDVPIAPDVPRIDVAKQLAQPILEFSQEKPIQVRRLLQQVAEMSAVPVDSSAVEIDPWKERLDRSVTLVLKETTVGGILAAVIELSGLRTETIDGVIHILPPAAEDA